MMAEIKCSGRPVKRFGLCNFAIEVKNEVFHGEFTTDTHLAKGRQIDKGERRDRQAVAAALAGGTRRLNSAQMRALWERANPGQKVPFDEVQGRFYDMDHIQAIADGGTNDPENLQPLERGEHMARHANDFVRWGQRAAEAAKGKGEAIESGAEDTGRAIGDAANELVTDPGAALQDTAAGAIESVEAGELPPP